MGEARSTFRVDRFNRLDRRTVEVLDMDDEVGERCFFVGLVSHAAFQSVAGGLTIVQTCPASSWITPPAAAEAVSSSRSNRRILPETTPGCA